MRSHMVRVTCSQLSLCLLLALVCASECRGQFETAAVLGTVLDPHAAAVAKAHVTVQNLDTGVQQATLTDERGEYEFLEVHVGRYKVVVQCRGFKRAETQEFRVEVGARQRVNVSLEVGEVSQTVEVHD